jgi:hypothetical protein
MLYDAGHDGINDKSQKYKMVSEKREEVIEVTRRMKG